MLLLSLGRRQRVGVVQVFGALHLQKGMQEVEFFGFVSPGTHLWQVLAPSVLCPPAPLSHLYESVYVYEYTNLK